MSKVPVVSRFYDRKRTPTESVGKSLTLQSMAAECDINKIMERFARDGLVTHVAEWGGDYGDFVNAPQSYHEALNQVLDAEDMFMTLPAHVREKYENDPGRFLEAVQDPEKREELQELGVLPRAAEQAPAQPAAGAKAEAPVAPEKAGEDPGAEK